jgi:hypothetical protein
MNLQKAMFAQVENWLVSGESKTVFLTGKNYSDAKFEAPSGVKITVFA